MRIVHIKSSGFLSEEARRRLEHIFYLDARRVVAEVKACFPNHVVSSQDGYIRVTNRDKSVTIALFQQVTGGF